MSIRIASRSSRSSLACVFACLMTASALSAVACDNKKTDGSDPQSSPSTTPEAASPQDQDSAESVVKKGQPIPAGPRLPIATVLANPDEYADQTVTVDGEVQSVCTRAGCWMEISSATADADADADAAPSNHEPGAAAAKPKSCRVSFNHAFAVPRTSGGDTATVHGVVRTRKLSPEMVKHLEEEGGTFPIKFADGSAREVAIVADGVELRQ